MKVYIRAFSLPRKRALERLDNVSEDLNEHVIKCIIFGKYRPTAYSHWLHEVVTFIASCDKGNISGANLKDKDYRETLFGSFGTDASDARDNLQHFKAFNLYQHHKVNLDTALPYFRINDTMQDRLFNCYQDLMDTCIPILRDTKVHPTNFWKNIVGDIIHRYEYNLSEDDIVENMYDE